MEKVDDNKICQTKRVLSRVSSSILLFAMIAHQACIWLNKDVIFSFYMAYVAGLALALFFAFSAISVFKASKLKFCADIFGAVSSLFLAIMWTETFYVKVFGAELICLFGILVAILAEIICNKTKETRVALTICGAVMLALYGLLVWRYVLLYTGKTFNTNLWDGLAVAFAAVSMFVIPLIGHDGEIEKLKRNEKLFRGVISVVLGFFTILIFDQKSAMNGAFMEAGWLYAKWFVIVAFAFFAVNIALSIFSGLKYKHIKTPTRFCNFILSCVGAIIALIFAILITVYISGLAS